MQSAIPFPKIRAASRAANKPDKAESTPVKRLSLAGKFLLWVYFLSFSFDFKGKVEKGTEASGSSSQLFFLVVCILSGVGLYLLLLGGQQRSRGLKRISGFWWVYLASTLFTVLLYNYGGGKAVEWGHYLRTIIPFFLCGLSLLITQALCRKRINPTEILLPLIGSGIVSSLWRVFYATRIRGIDIEEMRYQLLSPYTPLLFAFGLAGIFLERRPRLMAVVAFFASLMTILLSVTRSYVITLVFCVAALIYLYLIDRKMVSMKYLGQKLALLIVPYLALQMVIIIRPQTVLIWEVRLFHQKTRGSGQDLTALTRQAEYSWMWKDINKETTTLLLGRGIGQDYRWDSDYHGKIARYIYWDGDNKRWSTGHSVWMYALFSSGFLFGSMIYILFAVGLYHSLRLAKQYIHYENPAVRQVLLLPFLGVVAYLSQSFTANPFGERSSGQILGILFGAAFWFYHLAASPKPSRQENAL